MCLQFTKVCCTPWPKEGARFCALFFILTMKGSYMTVAEFTVALEANRTIEDLLRSGNYDEVNFLVREGIRKKRFSVRDESVGKRKIVLLGMDDKTTFETLLNESRGMGLDKPTVTDVFLFGEQHPQEQLLGPIVFLHEDRYLWNGYFFNFVLSRSKRGRVISLASSGGLWHSDYRFAFRGR